MTDEINKIWFATQDVIAQLKDPNKIRCGVKKDTNELTIDCFKDIKKGNIVVYYAFECQLILGLYKVTSSERGYELDYNGNRVSYYCIERLPDNKGYLDIIKLSEEGNDKFLAFPKGILRTNLKDKELIKELPQEDYARISRYFKQDNLLSSIEIDEKKVAVLSASLEFFGNRATSFVNLFVASIFGIVTLSAIIQVLNATSAFDIIILHISMVPFAAFAIAGWYTLQKYFHYGDIAERIRFWGLTFPYYKDLSSVKELRYTKTNGVTSAEIADLVDCLHGNNQIKGGASNKTMAAFKNFISEKNNFAVLYFFVISLLFIVVYYAAYT